MTDIPAAEERMATLRCAFCLKLNRLDMNRAVDRAKCGGCGRPLDRDQLWEGRDLAVTTDFRAVLAEVVRGHLGTLDLETVFPGFTGLHEPGEGLMG